MMRVLVRDLLVVGILAAYSRPAAGEQGSINGRVTDERGTPMQDVTVEFVAVSTYYEDGLARLAGRDGEAPARSTSTAADGSYRLGAPSAGLWTVRASKTGFVSMEFPPQPVFEETTLPPVELTPDAGATVLIVDQGGQALPGVALRAGTLTSAVWARAAASGWRPTPRFGRADDEGRARLPRAPAEFLRVMALAPGHLEAELPKLGKEPARLPLARGEWRTLQVVDERGKPLSGVLARLGEGFWPVGLTDRDGRLTVTTRPGASLPLNLFTADGRHGSQALTTPAGGQVGPAAFSLSRPDSIAGQVTDRETGRPLAGVLLWIDGDLRRNTRTSEDGRFSLPGEATDQTLRAAAPGHLPARAEVPSAGKGPRSLTLALVPAAAAAGVVVDGAGRPVAWARLRARPAPGAEHAAELKAYSARDGGFRIAPLPPGIAYVVEISAPRFAPNVLPLPALSSRAPRSGLRVVLESGRVARGKVVDDRSRPVAGARVSLDRMEGEDSSQRPEGPEPTETDLEGQFLIVDLAAGRYDLLIESPGFVPAALPGVSIPSQRREVDVGTIALARGASLEGRVLDSAGEPIEGAEVELKPIGPVAPTSVRTGVDGRFVLADLAGGARYDLGIQREGYAEVEVEGVQAPTDEPLTVVLESTCHLSGRVLDSGGRAVPGATVMIVQARGRIASASGPTFTQRRGRGATADDSGSFRIEEVEPGIVQLQAAAPGFGDGKPLELDIEPGRDVEGIDLVLPAGVVISGRVRGPDGRAVGGARVRIIGVAARIESEFAETSSDGTGRFRLEGVKPGSHRVEAAREGYGRAVREVEAREGEAGVDLTLVAAWPVSGRVVDDVGQSVAAARGALRPVEGTDEGVETVSLDDGRYAFPAVADGAYTLVFGREGYASSAPQRVVIEEGPIEGLEVRLPAGASLVGLLAGVEASELGRVEITASGPRGQVRQGRPDAEGKYRVRGLAPGAWRVEARITEDGRRATGAVTVESGAREVYLDLDFGRGFRVSGQVILDGRPLDGAFIRLRALDGSPAGSDETGHDGRFHIAGLEPGRYRVELSSLDPLLSAARTLDLIADMDLPWSLSSVQVRGRVLSSDGAPAGGALVTIQALEAGTPSPLAAAAMADGSGRFSLEYVLPGHYRVLASRPSFTPTAQEVEVQPGREPEPLVLVLASSDR